MAIPEQVIFTPAEIQRYLKYIELPENFGLNSPQNIEFLTALHVHQISKVPYENLSLHYSSDHKIILEPRFVYNKILNGRNRGGYCMEISVFFSQLLRSLGFKVYFTGVRIRPRVDGIPVGDYMGLVHIINIVTLETGEKYAVDVGFGGDGPTKPLPLVVHKVHTNLGAQEIRYDYASIAQFQSDCRFWIYQYRNGKDREWLPYYCFSETPYLREDFDIMNYYSSSPANKNQNANILLVKFMRTGSQITGKRTVFNNIVKENTGGKSKVLVNCKNEEERIEAFKEHFGIILLEEERNGIKGRVTELPS